MFFLSRAFQFTVKVLHCSSVPTYYYSVNFFIEDFSVFLWLFELLKAQWTDNTLTEVLLKKQSFTLIWHQCQHSSSRWHDMADKLGLNPDIRELKLGSSFTNASKGSSFHTLRCEFDLYYLPVGSSKLPMFWKEFKFKIYF